MNLQDFATLEDAHAHPVASAKMVSADQMRIFVVMCGLYSYFKTHTGDYQMATYDNMLSAGEFNFINNHPSNVTSLLDVMIQQDPEVTAKMAKLRDMCIMFANRVTHPFKNVTQEEFDKVKLESAYYGSQEASDVIYMGMDYHVKLEHEDVRLTVRLDYPVIVDTVVDFGLLIRNTDNQEFSPISNWNFQIVVPAGSTTQSKNITSTKQLTRHSQFSAKSNTLIPFTVEVTGV